MNIPGVIFSKLCSLFGTQKKLYKNIDIWIQYGDRIPRETRVVPIHSDEMILGSWPITPNLIQTVCTHTWGDTMNVLSPSENSGIVSHLITFDSIQTILSPVIFYKPHRK